MAGAGISSLLCMCLALDFQMGTQPKTRGLQRELASLEELPAYCSCQCSRAVYICTNPANSIACPALFMGGAGS